MALSKPKPSEKKPTSMTDFYPKNPQPSCSTDSQYVDLGDQGNGDQGMKRTFLYCLSPKDQKITVTKPTSWTVLEALNTSNMFIKKRESQSGKEIVIQRQQSPRAAVNVDFPLFLIEEKEVLTISFIEAEENTRELQKKKTKPDHPHACKDLISFNTKTEGGTDIVKTIMKNRNLIPRNPPKEKITDVCVYAYRGETVKEALRRDGRFDLQTIFKKDCALFDPVNKDTTEMKTLVDSLDGKPMEIILLSKAIQIDSQESQDNDNNEPTSSPPSLESEHVDPTRHSIKTERAEGQLPFEKAQKSRTQKKKHMIECKTIPDSQEVLDILRSQFGDLLKQLKEREGLRNSSEVQKLFKEEYDKSRQSFSEVKRVKELMTLSASVCQIRIDGSARGTGFLLFDRFILTNAHVIKDICKEFLGILKLQGKVTAVFNFEDLDKRDEGVAVKDEPVAGFYGSNDVLKCHLDFALLELSKAADMPPLPALLSNYRLQATPQRGGICIIGHPEGGVKRIDPCFLIERQNQPEAVKEHILENQDFLHVMQNSFLGNNWHFEGSQINYNSCFFHGSSGSPVFDERCLLIGVHTGGFDYKGKREKTRSIIEYAYPILHILVSIIQQATEKGRDDVLEYFKSQKHLEYVLQIASRPYLLWNLNNSGLDSTTVHQALFDK